jgi:hypothetical protein
MNNLDCIIHLSGGLGNQLFQYALGRRLQLEQRARVRYDLTMYKVKTDRDLTICKYRTKVPEVSGMDQTTMRLSFGRTLGRFASLLKPLKSQLFWQVLEDKRKGFDQEIVNLTGRWYLRGWWHAPAYFESLRPLLLEEFQPVEKLAEADHEVFKRIHDVNAVCLHVRRGDYVNHPVYSKQLKVQSADHYNTCLQEMIERVEKPHVFVFSDDAEWTRENIRGNAPITFMDKNKGSSDYIDLHLMSQCRHFITANSTFSWWAAWLAKNEEKIVMVPPVWGFDGAGPPPEMIPTEWEISRAEQLQQAGVTV